MGPNRVHTTQSPWVSVQPGHCIARASVVKLEAIIRQFRGGRYDVSSIAVGIMARTVASASLVGGRREAPHRAPGGSRSASTRLHRDRHRSRIDPVVSPCGGASGDSRGRAPARETKSGRRERDPSNASVGACRVVVLDGAPGRSPGGSRFLRQRQTVEAAALYCERYRGQDQEGRRNVAPRIHKSGLVGASLCATDRGECRDRGHIWSKICHDA